MTGTYNLKAQIFVEAALKFVGVTENGGDNRGPEVEMFQKAVDGKAAQEAWCLGFSQYCVREADKKYSELFEGTTPKNILFQTEHVLTLWNKTPKENRIEKPHVGCLILWNYYKDGKQTTLGHVGIVSKIIDDTFCQSVEGNTSPSNSVQRNGDGVYLKTRAYSSTASNMRILGFISCWDVNFDHDRRLRQIIPLV
ncbi:MAG: CHAP domain-containing protein [Bacteroidota bacterium]|nr:CHAP domain-containing protein [Bacteroidota bacterium]